MQPFWDLMHRKANLESSQPTHFQKPPKSFRQAHFNNRMGITDPKPPADPDRAFRQANGGSQVLGVLWPLFSDILV